VSNRIEVAAPEYAALHRNFRRQFRRSVDDF
jgi:hypothetical protein